MLLKIKDKNINSTSLILYLLYIEELIHDNRLFGKLKKNIQIKRADLINIYKIDYDVLKSTLSSLGIIKKDKKQNHKYWESDTYRINKSRLLIATFACMGINCLNNYHVNNANKEGFSFLKILNGIDKSVKRDSNSLYHSKKEYEQKIVTYVYESLSILINYMQIQVVNHSDDNKTTILLFFEDIKTGTNKYSLLSNTNHIIPTIDSSCEQLFHHLVSLTSFYFFHSTYSSSYSSSLSISSLISLSSLSKSPIYINNYAVYLYNFLNKLSISLISHKSNMNEKDIYCSDVKMHLDAFDGFGRTYFSLLKKELMPLSLRNDTEGSFLDRCEKGMVEYLNETSPLFNRINTLIEEINQYSPLYQFSFRPKLNREELLSGETTRCTISGRQYNKLCDFKAHKRVGEEIEPERPRLLKKLGYDSEGYDISSTIWTIAKAIVTGKPDISFDLKQILFEKGYLDKDGNPVKTKKVFKPINQITFFCNNAHHAYETYLSPTVRAEFEEKFGPQDYWLEMDEKTFSKIYYDSIRFIGSSKDFRETIFFYESILELSVIKRCYEEGIEVLNVYDCFFLKDKEKYPRLKDIIQEELMNLIRFYWNEVK